MSVSARLGDAKRWRVKKDFFRQKIFAPLRLPPPSSDPKTQRKMHEEKSVGVTFFCALHFWYNRIRPQKER